MLQLYSSSKNKTYSGTFERKFKGSKNVALKINVAPFAF